MVKAVYAGTFDPPTDGHQYIIETASRLVEELYVSVGINPAKKTMFDLEERKLMLTENCRNAGITNVFITDYTGLLLIDYASELGVEFIIRGIRSTEDFNYEVAMKLLNERANTSIETIYLVPPRQLSEVSSSVVKSLLGFKNWERIAAQYVSPFVLQKLREKS